MILIFLDFQTHHNEYITVIWKNIFKNLSYEL
jgi:hypothetical protein